MSPITNCLSISVIMVNILFRKKLQQFIIYQHCLSPLSKPILKTTINIDSWNSPQKLPNRN